MTDHGRTTVLLTGFGPFPGVPDNATMTLVPQLAAAAERHFPGTAFVADVLSTDWIAAPARVDWLLAAHAPDLMVHFGVSGRARGFEIERRGHNARAFALDATARPPETYYVRKQDRDRRPVSIPVAEIVRRLQRRGVPAFASWSAGDYLCNATLYHALAETEHLDCAAGFVHVPATLSPGVPWTDRKWRGRTSPGCPLTWRQALEGALDIVATCLGRPGPPQAHSLRRNGRAG